MAGEINIYGMMKAATTEGKAAQAQQIFDTQKNCFITDPEWLEGKIPEQKGTTYTFEGGINSVKVTPDDGEEQVIPITPVIEGVSASIIENLSNQVLALSLGAKLTLKSSRTVIEKGTSTAVKLTASFAGVVPDSVAIKDGDTVLFESDALVAGTTIVKSNNATTQEASTDAGIAINFNVSTTANKTYTAEATYKGMAFTSSVTVQAKNCILYGFCNPGEDPTKKYTATTTGLNTYEDTAIANGQVFCIYVPSDQNITMPKSFSMGSAPAAYSSIPKEINSIKYVAYISQETYNTGKKLTIKAS